MFINMVDCAKLTGDFSVHFGVSLAFSARHFQSDALVFVVAQRLILVEFVQPLKSPNSIKLLATARHRAHNHAQR